MDRRQKQRKPSKKTERYLATKASNGFRFNVVAVIVIAGMLVSVAYIFNRAVPEQHQLHRDPPSANSRSSVQITNPFDVNSIDTEKQRWPAEVLNEKIIDQLTALAELLSSDRQIKTDAIRRFLSDDVLAVDLNPKTEVCFTDGIMRIRRVNRGARQIEPEKLVGIDHVATGLESMVRPFKKATNLHVKFKIIHIEIADETASTTVRVSLDGKTSDHSWQQNAIWNCNWSTAVINPLLTRLDSLPDEYEKVVFENDQPLFSDQTEMILGQTACFAGQLRQDTNYWLSRLESAHGIDLVAAHGLAIADVNGDGLDDVYVCQPGGLPNRLFVATANGSVNERAAEYGLDICDTTRSALFVDLDNDGDQDVALVVADQVIVFENSATGKFVLKKQITIPINPTSLVAADFDSDRLLDLYVLNHDTDTLSTKNGILGTPIPFHDANNGGANVLLRNLGHFEFHDVTADLGLNTNNHRFSLAGCWEDFDDDGDMDLYVANDFGRNNLYRNDNGQFVDAAGELGVEDLSAGMSVSWGDVNNDGRQDLYVSNMFSSAGNRIAYQRDFHASESQQTRNNFQRHARGNSLFLQTNDHRFQDVSQSWNVTMGRWAWASKFADINNDGWLDILITNGFVTNEDTNDL